MKLDGAVSAVVPTVRALRRCLLSTRVGNDRSHYRRAQIRLFEQMAKSWDGARIGQAVTAVIELRELAK